MSDSTTQTNTVLGVPATPGGPPQATSTSSTIVADATVAPLTSTTSTLVAPAAAAPSSAGAQSSVGQPLPLDAAAAPSASLMTLPDLEDFVTLMRKDLDSLSAQVKALGDVDQSGAVPFTQQMSDVLQALRPYAKM